MNAARLLQSRSIHAICTIVTSWLLMQVCHESGHAFAALFTGGTVRRVVLVPWELSRTDLIQNPHPLLVCWAGPAVGVLLPLILWLLSRTARWRIQFVLRFLAGFCLIANGTYIGFGSLTLDGDAGELILHGSPKWMLWLFLSVTAPAGLFLWHGLGRHFGFGPGAETISGRTAMLSAIALITVILIESLFSWI